MNLSSRLGDRSMNFAGVCLLGLNALIALYLTTIFLLELSAIESCSFRTIIFLPIACVSDFFFLSLRYGDI